MDGNIKPEEIIYNFRFDSDYKAEDAASELVEKYLESDDRTNWLPADDFRKIMFDYVAKHCKHSD